MTEPVQQPLPMTDSQKLLALALALKAIDDAHEELAAFKSEIKSRVENLLKETRALRYEILSGQERLPLESEPATSTPDGGQGPAQASPPETKSVDAKEENNVSETSTEERLRTRAAKKRKKLLGQDAILPDKRTQFPNGHGEVQS